MPCFASWRYARRSGLKMTARATFTKADGRRAIECVRDCGLPVARVEFTENGIVVIVGEPEKGRGKNPLDRIHGS